jgi:hypothetical protein
MNEIEKKKETKMGAEIVLKSADDGCQVDVLMDAVVRRRPSIFDSFLTVYDEGVYKTSKTKSYWFDTDVEGLKFVKDLGKELKEKGYEVEASKTIVTREVIKLE